MAAARARWRFLALQIALFLAIGTSRGLVRPEAAPRPPVPKAISDLRDAIVKGLGFQSEELKVSGFDVRDALVGQAVAYEFDIEVSRKVVPVRLLEDVKRWDFVDLPIFRSQADADDTALAEIPRGAVKPILPPFQLAGPMELWIQDGDDVRLALPVRGKGEPLAVAQPRPWSTSTVCGSHPPLLRSSFATGCMNNKKNMEFIFVRS